MTTRRAAIAVLLLLIPVAVVAPLLWLPDPSEIERSAPSAEESLDAWAEETLTGAQLPAAEPARRLGHQQRHEARAWWVLADDQGCWGVRMDRLSEGPRRLDADVCAKG